MSEGGGNFGGMAIGPVLGATVGEGVGHYKSKLAWSRTKRMMQNRHQWEVNDLRAAGLNPILSAGAAPSMGTPQQGADQGWAGAAGVEKETGRKGKMDAATRLNLAAQRSLLAQQGLTEISKRDLNTANAANVRAQTQRYGPVSELGGAAKAAMGDLKGGVTNARQNLLNIIGGNAQAGKQQRDLNAKNLETLMNAINELERKLRESGLKNDKWSDNWKDKN